MPVIPITQKAFEKFSDRLHRSCRENTPLPFAVHNTPVANMPVFTSGLGGFGLPEFFINQEAFGPESVSVIIHTLLYLAKAPNKFSKLMTCGCISFNLEKELTLCCRVVDSSFLGMRKALGIKACPASAVQLWVKEDYFVLDDMYYSKESDQTHIPCTKDQFLKQLYGEGCTINRKTASKEELIRDFARLETVTLSRGNRCGALPYEGLGRHACIVVLSSLETEEDASCLAFESMERIVQKCHGIIPARHSKKYQSACRENIRTLRQMKQAGVALMSIDTGYAMMKIITRDLFQAAA